MQQPITAETTSITVRIPNDRNFSRGVANAKRLGGKFDAGTKTWTVPTATIIGRTPGEFSFVLVGQMVPAANVCQGCHDPKCRDGECGFGIDYIEVR